MADPVLALEDEIGGRERGITIAALDGIRREHVLGLGGSKTGAAAWSSGPWPGDAPRAASPCRAPRSAPAARRGAGSRRRPGTRIGWSSLIELTTFSPGMSAAVTTTTFDQSNDGIELERVEGRVRIGRADRRAVPGARDDDVVGVEGGAGQLRRALAAERRGRAGATRDDRAGGMTSAPGARSGSSCRDDTIADGPSDPLSTGLLSTSPDHSTTGVEQHRKSRGSGSTPIPRAAGARIIRARRRRWRARTMRGAAGG